MWLQEAGQGIHLEHAKANAQVWVQLSRRGNVWTAGRSADGKEWKTWKCRNINDNTTMPDELVVGVFLLHEADQTCEAEFAGLTVERVRLKK